MNWHSTSVTLASRVLEKKFVIAGTMSHDRKGIIKKKAVINREEKSAMLIYDK